MALTGGAAILARLRAQREAGAAKQADAKAAAAAVPDVLILYASQTGTGQEIAKAIHSDAAKHNVKAKVMSFNECGVEPLTAEPRPFVVIVASSTGDGDPPDNSAKAFVTLRRKSQPSDLLKGVQYTVLGLGDSNYTRFMYVPRAFKSRFAELGATLFYDCAEADEVDGIEEAVDPWSAGLWEPLKEALAKASATATADKVNGLSLATSVSSGPTPCRLRLVFDQEAAAVPSQEPSPEALAYRDPTGQYSSEEPFYAQVVDARYLTTQGAGKRVIHLALNIASSNTQYNPGDSVGILVKNPPGEVQSLLQRLGAKPEAVFRVESTAEGTTEKLLAHLQWPCTLQHAFECALDITGPPRKSLLQLLATACTDDAERTKLHHLASREGREEYTKQIMEPRTSLLQLLKQFPSCKPPLDSLVDALPSLAPRMYSTATAPQVHPDQVHVAFSVVEHPTPTGTPQRYGVATGYLEALLQPLLTATKDDSAATGTTGVLRLPVFHRSGGAFHPPGDVSKPWIMIGPGTGVAPFRGFLHYRKALLQAQSNGKRSAPAWLFFGCRRKDEDYLYREDLEAFAADGTLDKLEVAFSRAQEKKVYVQHLMKRHGSTLFQLIEDEGYVFVCGDGAAMAKDVHACLSEIIQQEGGVDKQEAEQQLQHMAKQGRYVRDIWS